MGYTGYEIKHKLNYCQMKTPSAARIEKWEDGNLVWSADYEAEFNDNGDVCAAKFINIETYTKPFNEKGALAQVKIYIEEWQDKYI